MPTEAPPSWDELSTTPPPKWDELSPTPPKKEQPPLVASPQAIGNMSQYAQMAMAGAGVQPMNVNPEQAKYLAETVRGMGLRGAPPAIGQFIGAEAGPLAPAAMAILGFLGGAGGEAAAEAFEPGKMSWRRIIGAGVANAVPGAPLANATAKQLAIQTAKQATANIAATAIEKGKDMSPVDLIAPAGAAVVGTATGKLLDSGSAAAATRAEEQRAAPMLKTLKETKEAGLIVNPEALKVSQNDLAVNALARKDIGLPADAPFDLKTIDNHIEELWKPYERVAKVSPRAAEVLSQLKKARFEANRQFKFYDRSLNPEAQDKAFAAQSLAENLEASLRAIVELDSGLPKSLVDEMVATRRMLAKAYLAKQAMNETTGIIDPRVYARSLTAGAPLDSEALTIANAYKSGLIRDTDPMTLGQAAPPSSLRKWAWKKFEQSDTGQNLLANPQYVQRADLDAEIARITAQQELRKKKVKIKRDNNGRMSELEIEQ